MYKNFNLTESEKEQILNMHKNHGYGQPLNEQSQPFLPATELIRKGYKGPGTDTASLVKGFQLIKSAADYKTVEGQLIQYGGYKSLIDVLNGELGSSDNVPAQQIQAALKAAGVDLQYKNMVNVNGGKFVEDFKLGAAPVAAAVTPQLATNGWWDNHPALASYMKENAGKVYYPPAANSATGAIAIDKGGPAWDFFSDGRWYQYASVEEGLKAVVKAQYEGKWSEKNGLLMIQSNDGTTWNSKTKKWAEPIPWVKQSGKFPLKYLEYGSTIKPLQTALKLKADGYFYNLVEKSVLAKAPEYKRETGVTQEIYNKIVPNVAVGKDLKTTYDMNTQAGKDAYLQQGLKNQQLIPPLQKYSQSIQLTPQQQANADALKSGQPLPKQ
jgi:hypothetical protein